MEHDGTPGLHCVTCTCVPTRRAPRRDGLCPICGTGQRVACGYCKRCSAALARDRREKLKNTRAAPRDPGTTTEETKEASI